MSKFEEFLEKIKSLQIQTSKPGALCSQCGKPLSAHKVCGLAVGIARRQKKHDDSRN